MLNKINFLARQNVKLVRYLHDSKLPSINNPKKKNIFIIGKESPRKGDYYQESNNIKISDDIRYLTKLKKINNTDAIVYNKKN